MSGVKKQNPKEKAKESNKSPAPEAAGADGFTQARTPSQKKRDKKKRRAQAAETALDPTAADKQQAAAAEVLTGSSDQKIGGRSTADESEQDSDAESQKGNTTHVYNNGDDSSDEEGEISEPGSRGVAGDMLDDDNDLGGGRLIPGSALERFVVGALNHAVKTKTDPPGFVLQLALGTSTPDAVIAQLGNQNELLTARVNALEEAFEQGQRVASVTNRNSKDRSRDKTPKKTPSYRDKATKTVTWRDRNGSRDGKSANKKPRTADEECDFPLCKHTNGRFTHSRADCHHEATLKKHKYKVVQKP